jgi:acyl-coenzyme A synthetase/AMP-(fatty) acid ligase
MHADCSQGLQVAPAELEAHLLTHPAVNDCVVIGVPSDREGEVPKAFVVKSPSVGLEDSDRMVARDIARHVERHKAKHKWLKGGVEFIDIVPKSPSGKILRRLLRRRRGEARERSYEFVRAVSYANFSRQRTRNVTRRSHHQP